MVVYGVEIPGEEGRAGMAAIVCSATKAIDVLALGVALQRELPAYALPLFIRLVTEVEHTGTFKVKKSGLVEQAYNPARLGGAGCFYWEARERSYRELSSSVYQEIVDGKKRFWFVEISFAKK